MAGASRLTIGLFYVFSPISGPMLGPSLISRRTHRHGLPNDPRSHFESLSYFEALGGVLGESFWQIRGRESHFEQSRGGELDSGRSPSQTVIADSLRAAARGSGR